MMEERKENDFKMDTEDLRLLNAFGEALGDLPSEEETRAAWNAFTSRQDAQKRRRIIQMWTSGIAAAIVVLVVLIVPRITNEDTIQDIEIFAALDVPEAIITSENNGRITLSTPPATTTQIILDDGTQVTLNANSRLEYPKQFPAEGTREVHLTGEARFEVAKDSARPDTGIGHGIRCKCLSGKSSGSYFISGARPRQRRETNTAERHIARTASYIV